MVGVDQRWPLPGVLRTPCGLPADSGYPSPLLAVFRRFLGAKVERALDLDVGVADVPSSPVSIDSGEVGSPGRRSRLDCAVDLGWLAFGFSERG